jgi:acyl dehydratase
MNQRAIRYHREDFPAKHRQELGHTAITREQIVGFASQFDPQPFHLEDEAARQTPFGALCASGWHTCSIATRLMCDGYLLEAASVGSPGRNTCAGSHPSSPATRCIWRSKCSSRG